MKFYHKIVLFSLLICCSSLLQAKNESFLKDINFHKYSAKQPEELRSMNDGIHYTMLSEDGKRIESYEYASGKKNAIILDLDKIEHCPIKKIAGYEFSKNESRILIHTQTTPIYRHSFTTTYYVYSIQYKQFDPLSTKPGKQQLAHFSPNGRLVAFSRDNNLFIKKLDFNTEIQITKDGKKNHIINGTADWVYEEEFACTRYFEWNADSKLLAYVKFDETNIPQYNFQWNNDSYPTISSYKYPFPGTENSKVSVHVFNVKNNITKQMDCGEGNNIYFSKIQWTAKADALAVVRLNRNQTQLDLLSVNPNSGISTTLIHEKATVYVDYENMNSLQFLEDNSFVCASEKDGYRHLYLHRANGLLKKQLTSGKWDVTANYGYNPNTQIGYFQAAKRSPMEREVYKVDRKGIIHCLSKKKGTNGALFSSNYKYAITNYSNLTTPTIYSIIDVKRNKTLRVIQDNQEIVESLATLNLPKKQFFQFKNSKELTLNGWIVKPNDFDSTKQYPLVMVQYSGPSSQQVLNKYKIDWEYYLAQNGYIVACIDPSGTNARGRKFRTLTYKKLGQLEREDQIDAAKYLGSKKYIDASRMAIWGWSYGGFMVLNCMTHSNIFKAGIAIAPVTDWRLYDSTYTERYMQRPQENGEGYDQSCLNEEAKNLSGNLLIVHGTVDDNVHIQHTYLFIDELIKANKQFDMQVYPNKQHSILGNQTRYHLYTRFVRFLNQNL